MRIQSKIGQIKLNTICLQYATVFKIGNVSIYKRILLCTWLLVYCFSVAVNGQTNSSPSIETLPPIQETQDVQKDPLDDARQDQDADPRNVLMSGPMHEAFMDMYQADPKPNTIVLKTPPEPVNEIPPEYKPQGSNVLWIPGYWAWDIEKEDFVWVSGLWRDVPPDRKWIPGYWQELEEGFRWVSGFWQKVSEESIEYLPPPPESIETGPSTVAPGDDYFYVPGNWVMRDSNYCWSPGYWQTSVDQWIWIPARYIWTPHGCVYRPGYWDHAIDQRGVLFAPMYYSTPYYRNVGYRYIPRYVIQVGIDLLPHLFVNLRHGHYYYGDWYGIRFQRHGIHPWVHAHRHHKRYYDPLLAYYTLPSSRYNNRNAFDWARDHHQHVSTQVFPKPGRTFGDINISINSNNQARRPNQPANIGLRYSDYVNKGSKNQKLSPSGRNGHSNPGFQRMSSSDRKAETIRLQPLNDIRLARKSHETKAKSRNSTSVTRQVQRLELPGKNKISKKLPFANLAGKENHSRVDRSNTIRQWPKNGVSSEKSRIDFSRGFANSSASKSGKTRSTKQPFILAPRPANASVKSRDLATTNPNQMTKQRGASRYETNRGKSGSVPFGQKTDGLPQFPNLNRSFSNSNRTTKKSVPSKTKLTQQDRRFTKDTQTRKIVSDERMGLDSQRRAATEKALQDARKRAAAANRNLDRIRSSSVQRSSATSGSKGTLRSSNAARSVQSNRSSKSPSIFKSTNSRKPTQRSKSFSIGGGGRSKGRRK